MQAIHEVQKSHPTGVRGLKFIMPTTPVVTPKSHPTGVRGLKFDLLPSMPSGVSRTPLGCVD